MGMIDKQGATDAPARGGAIISGEFFDYHGDAAISRVIVASKDCTCTVTFPDGKTMAGKMLFTGHNPLRCIKIESISDGAVLEWME